MTDLTHDLEHTARGVERLIERYRKPRTSALLASWLDEVQEVEDALWQLLVERWLASAEGDQLDVLGRIVGEPRRGRDDDTYRIWISARNLVSRSSGKTTEMLAIARKLVAPEVTVALEEYYPAAFVMRFGAGLDLDTGYQIAFMLRQAKPAGVLFQMTWPVSGETFRFAPADVPVPASPYGFDAGAWAVVADGSFIPPEVEAPLVPLGTIVIEGTPVTIEGDYLVISPTTTLAARPPIVATPARIVPRAPAPAMLGPSLLAGDTIELVDAFADASLEMTPEGDKFRVALALQGVIEDLQASDSAQAIAIAALEVVADAFRVAFPLRTQSVDSTDGVEVGVMRFDATGLGAIDLMAELEVSAAGQTVELELWNLTSAALVATLSSTSLVTEHQSTPVTLPAAEVLYGVRLRRVGGDVTQRVSCRSVTLEIHDG